jgi:hypothetical protein
MRDEHLSEFKRRHLGNGYVERVPGTGKLLDTLHGVNMDVLSTGRFPGDDKPKPIAFPDRRRWPCAGSAFRFCPWGKDLVDIQELIKSAGLPASAADDLHPWVRGKFLELWQLAQVADPF